MSYRYIYDPVALNEYKDAISWYLERSELAAEGFVKEVNESWPLFVMILFALEIPINTFVKYH